MNSGVVLQFARAWRPPALSFPLRMKFTVLFSTLLAAAVSANAEVISVSAYDLDCYENWPDPAVFVLRRSDASQERTVNVTLTGSGIRNLDYSVNLVGNTATFAVGQREIFVEITPKPDTKVEITETVVLKVHVGAGYTPAPAPKDTVTGSIFNQRHPSGPSPEEAVRFLIQAGFGPDQDSPADADQIPENVEEVMALGFEGWINQQFARPVGRLLPFVQWAQSQPGSMEIYNDVKQDAWWGRAMGLPKLRPDAAATQAPDPLRQRVAFALSQIFVISDRMEDIGVVPEGMAHYYDMLLSHSFGNYRNLLFDVSLHPCMGMYLSHLGNRKPNPAENIFPDENYAREVMQLFSIGLWMLEPDGTRKLVGGNPVPTYTNTDITNFARVFTGLAFGGTNVNFGLHPRDFTKPMKGWDAEHDLAPKNLLLGTVTPARTASAGNTGTATMADVNAAIDNLFQHPNTGPFFARLLIQRFVTSNPSPQYVARVAAKFANNGSGVRGDMKAVMKAILLDPFARSDSKLRDETYGKVREPFLKVVNVARAFNAASQEGWYYLDAFILDHSEEPLKSPSVFNFYLPSYTPPGALAQNGLVAPEFQIINATSSVMAANYYFELTMGGMHRWGTARPSRVVKLNTSQEMLLNVPAGAVNDPSSNLAALDPDPLLRRLDLVLTGGMLQPQSFQLIREAMMQIGPASGYEWPRRRLDLAVYLIISSAEFSILR